jgi:hypothetical protein
MCIHLATFLGTIFELKGLSEKCVSPKQAETFESLLVKPYSVSFMELANDHEACM